MDINLEIKTDVLDRGLSAVKHTFIFKLLSVGASAITAILLVRGLNEHDYGVYSLLYAVIGVLGTVASLGIANTLQRYIPEYYARGEFKIANTLYRVLSFARLLSNVVLLGLALILWEQTAPYLKIAGYKSYFMFFTLIILLHMQRGPLEVCLGAQFLQKYSQGLSFMLVFVQLLGYSVAICTHMDLWNVLAIDLVAYVMIFAGLQLVYHKKIPVAGGIMEGFDKAERKRLARYAAFYNFNDAGVGFMKPDFDYFVIGLFLSPVEVGAYAFCQKVTNILSRLLPLKYFIDVVRPAFFSIGVGLKGRRVNEVYQFLVKMNFVCNIPMFFFMVLFADTVIRVVFGGRFLDYASLVIMVFFFKMINGFDLPVNLLAQLRERADAILYSKIFAAYNILADIVLIYYFGVLGAVLATGTATLGKNIFIWSFVREEGSFKGMGRSLLKTCVYWLLVSAVIYVFKGAIPNELAGLLVGCVFFGSAFIMQFRLRVFNSSETRIFEAISNRNPKLNYLGRLLGLESVSI